MSTTNFTSRPVNETKLNDYFNVDPRNILVMEGFNKREDYGDLEELKNSIVSSGLQVALLVSTVKKSDKFELVDGHRRLAAIMLALEEGIDIPFVKCMRFTGSDEDKLFAQFITGTGQKPLNLVEQSEIVKTLLNFEYTPEEIAKKIGKQVSYVYKLKTVSDMSKAFKNRIQSGKISTDAVLTIIKSEDKFETQMQLVEEAIENAGDKRATGKHLSDTVKKTTLVKRLDSTLEMLTKAGVDNEKVALLKVLVENKNASVEKLMELFS